MFKNNIVSESIHQLILHKEVVSVSDTVMNSFPTRAQLFKTNNVVS